MQGVMKLKFAFHVLTLNNPRDRNIPRTFQLISGMFSDTFSLAVCLVLVFFAEESHKAGMSLLFHCSYYLEYVFILNNIIPTTSS